MYFKHKAPANHRYRPVLTSWLRGFIESAHLQALQTTYSMQVRKCLEIWWHIVEFVRQDPQRTLHDPRLMPSSTELMVTEFGSRLYEKNLRHMRIFYQNPNICNAVLTDFVSTDYITLFRVEGARAHQWFTSEAAKPNWSARTLNRQVRSILHEHFLFSRDRRPANKKPSCRLHTR
jgi:hypothetical protein